MWTTTYVVAVDSEGIVDAIDFPKAVIPDGVVVDAENLDNIHLFNNLL